MQAVCRPPCAVSRPPPIRMVKYEQGNNAVPTEEKQPGKKRRGKFRWLKWLACILLVLFFLPIFIFQIPSVQNYTAQELTKYLSKEVGTEVSIARVKLNVFYEIRLEKFYIEDLHGDTLLYAGLIDVDHTGFHRLLNKELFIESLTIDDATITMSREAGEEFKNYQFLMDYFTPKGERQQIDKQESPFVFTLDHLLLTNFRFYTPDAAKGEDIDVHVARLEANINEFDLIGKNIEMESLNIFGPDVVLDQYERRPAPETPPIPQLVSGTETTTLPDSLWVFIKDFNLTGGTFKSSNRRKEPVKLTGFGILNFNHLDVYNINFNFKEFQLNDEMEFDGVVASSSLREQNGFILENLAAKEAHLNCTGLALLDMELRTPHTVLGDTLVFKYEDYYDWETFPQDVDMDLRFSEQAFVSLQDIMTFAPKLENNIFFKENKNEKVNITGHFTGPMDRLDGDNLKLNLADGVLIEGDFSTFGLTEKDEQFIHLEMDRMRSDVQTLRKLIPGFTPPENFDRLGNLDFSGNFDGFFVDFVAHGNLKTDIGSAIMDVNMKLQGGREAAQYSGDLYLNDFDLGIWTDNKDFGKITFNAAVKEGIGLSLNTAEAKVNGTIDSLFFKNYLYSNVQLDGELKKNLFNGDLAIDDKNVSLNFGGEVNFTGEVPAFDFKTEIRRLSLKTLNLSKQDLQFSGKANLALQGKRLSDIVGEAEVTDFQVVKNREDTLSMDKAVVTSSISEEGQKDFKFVSNLGNLDITGNFDIEKIPNVFVNFLHKNYPRFAQKSGLKQKGPLQDSMVFKYNLELFELQNLVNFFDEKINGFDKTLVKGNYDGVDGRLSLEMEIPRWSYGDIAFDDVFFRTNLNENEGDLQLGVIETAIGNDRKLSPISLIGNVYDDTLEFLIVSSNFYKILDNININGLISLEEDDAWRVSFKPSDLTVMNQLWNIDTSNFIRIGEGKVETKNFRLFHDEQSIVLKNFQGEGLELQLRNIPLQGIDLIRNIKKLHIEGTGNLDIKAENIFKQKGLSTFLQVRDLTVNGDDYGELVLTGNTNSVKESVNIGLSILGDTTYIGAKGYVNLPTFEYKTKMPNQKSLKNYFDFEVDMEQVPIKIVSYFVSELLNPTGYLNADKIHLYGSFDRPEMEGKLTAHDVSFKVKPIQTTYRITEGDVLLTSNAIDATGGFVLDKYNNKAFLNGGIVHDHFKDFGLDLTISTETDKPFLALETTEEDNAVFYGTAFGSGWARFTGSFRQTDLSVKGKTMPGTYMYLPLTTSTITQENNRFIRFTEEKRKREDLEEGTSETPEIRGIEMFYDMEITPEAKMEVIFDRAWGDVMSGSGRGNVTVDLKRSGDFKIFGGVEITEGDYLFTLMNLGINKSFKIRPGGKVNYSGDPYNADIDIDALYTGVSAPVYSLIQEYVTVASESTQDLARNPTSIELAMNLSGKLLTPDIKFDLSFPDLDSELKSFADNKLRAMHGDENELNRQVFGLLVLGQFLPSGSTIQAQDVGWNTISEMVSNQLSILVTQLISNLVTGSNFIKGIDVDFSINRFTTQDLNTTDLRTSNELGVKGKFIFNDRMSFNAGTEYGLGNNNISDINSGQWAGEFEFEINFKNRRFTFEAYSAFDPDITGGRRNKYGGRLIIRKEFDNVSELFAWTKKIKLKKKKGED